MVRSMLAEKEEEGEGQGGRPVKPATTTTTAAPTTLPSREDGVGDTGENRHRSTIAQGPSAELEEGVWMAGAGKVVRFNMNGVRGSGGSTTTTYVGATHFMAILDDVRDLLPPLLDPLIYRAPCFIFILVRSSFSFRTGTGRTRRAWLP